MSGAMGGLLPEAVAVARREDLQPVWGIVLGSGFGAFVDDLADVTSLPFSAIPGFPVPRVEGHQGRVYLGRLDATPIAVVAGRLHTYEGHDPAVAALPIRLLAALGVGSVFLTNAAGGVNPALRRGSLLLIADHLNLPGLTGQHPLRGSGADAFVAMADAYDPGLRASAQASARQLGIELREGVYAMVSGPSYETPAELRFLRQAGADAVGMSTASEVIVARHCGLRVLALSCISNAAHGVDEGIVDHRDVLAVVKDQVPSVLALFRDLLAHQS